MNKKQKRILWIGITIVILMGLFPPYEHSMRGREKVFYDFLLFTLSSELAVARLAVQWIIVSVLTASAIYSIKGSKEKTNVEPEKDA